MDCLSQRRDDRIDPGIGVGSLSCFERVGGGACHKRKTKERTEESSKLHDDC